MEQFLKELQESLGKLTQQLTDLPEKVAKQVPKPVHEQLQEQAFWIYGVIVSFCLRQVMTDILPRVLPAWFLDSGPIDLSGNLKWLEWLRLALFLLMITRFFLGSVLFYKVVSDRHPIDFFVGYLHFLFFFVWSMTLKSHPDARLSGYLWALWIILCLDVLYRFSPSWKTDKNMSKWAFMNLATAVCSFVLAEGFLCWHPDQPLSVELFAILPVIVVTLFDLIGISKLLSPK